MASVHTFIDHDGVRLCLERRGTGSRHVLFAHGWISSRRMWYDVVDRLDLQKFTVHLLDFRGCGISDRPETGHDLAGYASDLRAALQSVPGPAAIVAHSMGGRIAQFIATERPENLRRMILVAPGVAAASRPNEKQRALALAAFGSREKIERFQRAAMGVAVEEESMARIVDDALVAQREVWFMAPGGRTLDFSDRLAHIEVPVLAIAAEKDPLAPPSRVKRDVANVIPGCVFLMLRNAGHNLPVEAPDEIAGAVERFAIDS